MSDVHQPHYIRLRQLIGNPKARPPVRGLLPVSAATVWRMVKAGTLPAPVKLSPGVTVWDLGEVRQALAAAHCAAKPAATSRSSKSGASRAQR